MARSQRNRQIDLTNQHNDACLRTQLETVEGRTCLFNIIAQCGVYGFTFTGDNETFIKEGRRSIGCWLISEICRIDPMAYIKMQIEAAKREEQFKLRTN